MVANLKQYKDNEKPDFNALISIFTELKGTRKKRRCLMCGIMFDSTSAGNRRCHKCSKSPGLRIKSRTQSNRIVKITSPETNSIEFTESDDFLFFEE